MSEAWKTAVPNLDQGRLLALASILAARGSCLRNLASFLLVDESGKMVKTAGEGAFEAWTQEVRSPSTVDIPNSHALFVDERKPASTKTSSRSRTLLRSDFEKMAHDKSLRTSVPCHFLRRPQSRLWLENMRTPVGKVFPVGASRQDPHYPVEYQSLISSGMTTLSADRSLWCEEFHLAPFLIGQTDCVFTHQPQLRRGQYSKNTKITNH